MVLRHQSLVLSFVLLARSAAAQDVSYSPPADWARSAQAGMVSFAKTGYDGARPTYGQIFVFSSRAAAGDPRQIFVAEWARLIAQPFATTAQPQVQTSSTPNGWTVITGTITATQRGIPVVAILVSATAGGRAESIVINATAGDYAPEVRDFLGSLRFPDSGATAANPTPDSRLPAPESGSLDDYLITIPAGWTKRPYPDGIVYASPVFNTGERCQLTTFQMRRPSGDLLRDARRAFAEIFQEDPFQNNSYPYATATITRGTAATGWNYLIIQKPIHGRVGDGTLLGVRVFVARLNDRLAVITTTGKESLVSSCFGELVRDEWPAVFYSLGFKNWKAVPQDAVVSKQLAGAWVTATASVADRYVFAANGRFASAAAAMTVTRISATELLQTTNAYFGDGSYRIDGNRITLAMDRDPTHPQRGWFRIESDSQDSLAWKDRLCLLLEGIGEVCYKRDAL